MMIRKILPLVAVCVLLSGCYHKTDSPRGSWAKGADLSWLSEMERDSVFDYDCIERLRSMGMNAVRLRVWVNHHTGWSNKEDMLYLAKRAAKAGQRIMIDIHYSDFFADPNHQAIPAAWENYDYPTMLEAVREHTLDVLYALKEEGVKPEWVQIGNETPNGMLWPMGKVKGAEGNWKEYAGFTRMGYEAAKEAFPDITVIVHVDNAYERRDWFWKSMQANGGKWDMIGLSHYPMMSAWNGGKSWQEMNDLAEQNIKQLIHDWHCPVMIAEVGMFANNPESEVVMTDFINRITAIDSCVGIFYWEPEVFGGWRPAEYIPLGWGSYDMGAFTPDGQPSKVMEILLSSSWGSCAKQVDPTMDRSDFVVITDVVPDAILEIRYYSTYNFVGERIDGYEAPIALMTRQAADSLKVVSDELKAQGYRLKIWDAYRPQRAVNHFIRWAENVQDTAMKSIFYPMVDKSKLFEQGYILARSGHSRGSTVDLTLVDEAKGKELDMGSPFDWFGIESHPDYTGYRLSVSGERIQQNRRTLWNAMLRHGFSMIDSEWWHFTLANEPYPDTYFDFPVK